MVTNNSWNSQDPAQVSKGGTGAATLTGVLTGNGTSALTANAVTQYNVLLGGASNAVSEIGAVGTSGQVLTSNGAGSNPSWEDATSEQVVPVTALDNTDSPYTVLTTDYYLSCNVTSGTLTIQLPNAPTTGSVWVVKDSAGQAATNNITVTTVGGVVTLDGATSFVMNTAFEAANFLFNGTSYEVF